MSQVANYEERDGFSKMILNVSQLPISVSASSGDCSLDSTQVATLSIGISNPVRDCASENSTTSVKSYVRNLCCNQTDLEIRDSIQNIIMEHSYARPHSWQTESHVKPARTLMVPQVEKCPGCHKHSENHEIEVDTPPSPPPSLPYNIEKARHKMSAAERHFTKEENDEETEDEGNSEDDWDSKIDQSQWNLNEKLLFNKLTQILKDDMLARLTIKGHFNEPILRRNYIDRSVARFRRAYMAVGWDLKTLQWIHNILMDNLDTSMLPVYIDILQSLREKLPVLIEKMIVNGVQRTGSRSMDDIIPLLRRMWLPVDDETILKNIKKIPMNPIIVIVPEAPDTTGTHSVRRKQILAILNEMATVETVKVQIGPTGFRLTVLQLLEHMLSLTKTKLNQIKNEQPNRPIVLFGFNAGAALALQVQAMNIVPVSAIVCFGFSVHTAMGKRGTPDDIILDIPCPILFIIGQNSDRTDTEDMEDLREKMTAETSLVVVGGADDFIRLSRTKKILEGVTQSLVDRCLLDEVGEYIAGVLMNPNIPPATVATPNLQQNAETKKVPPLKISTLKIKKVKKAKVISGFKRKSEGSLSDAEITPVLRKKGRPGRPKGSTKNRHLMEMSPPAAVATSTITSSSQLQTALESLNNPPPGGVTVTMGSLRSPPKMPQFANNDIDASMMPPPPLKKKFHSLDMKSRTITKHKLADQLRKSDEFLDQAVMSIMPTEIIMEDEPHTAHIAAAPPSDVTNQHVINRFSDAGQSSVLTTSPSLAKLLLQTPSPKLLLKDVATPGSKPEIQTKATSSGSTILTSRGPIDLSQFTVVGPGLGKSSPQISVSSESLRTPKLPNAKLVKILGDNRVVLTNIKRCGGNKVIINSASEKKNNTSVYLNQQVQNMNYKTNSNHIVEKVYTEIPETDIFDMPIVFADQDGNYDHEIKLNSPTVPKVQNMSESLQNVQSKLITVPGRLKNASETVQSAHSKFQNVSVKLMNVSESVQNQSKLQIGTVKLLNMSECVQHQSKLQTGPGKLQNISNSVQNQSKLQTAGPMRLQHVSESVQNVHPKLPALPAILQNTLDSPSVQSKLQPIPNLSSMQPVQQIRRNSFQNVPNRTQTTLSLQNKKSLQINSTQNSTAKVQNLSYKNVVTNNPPKMVVINRNMNSKNPITISNITNSTIAQPVKNMNTNHLKVAQLLTSKRMLDGNCKTYIRQPLPQPLPTMSQLDFESELVANKVLKCNPNIITKSEPVQNSNVNIDSNKTNHTTMQGTSNQKFRSPIMFTSGTPTKVNQKSVPPILRSSYSNRSIAVKRTDSVNNDQSH